MEIRTILTPVEIAALPARDLRGTVCVVFDVLRATSTILAALANGAQGVWPVLTAAEAFAAREERLPEALLGGERGGLRIDGFDLGNSPREYTPEAVAGRDIVTTTTNGTVALRACAGAEAVLAAALVNLDATAAWLRSRHPRPERVLLVCAGTGIDFALEDGLAAGGLAERLELDGGCTFDDATTAMVALYVHHRGGLAAALGASSNGRRLAGIRLAEDLAWCARESCLDTVAAMEAGAVRSARNLLPKSRPADREGLPPEPNMR